LPKRFLSNRATSLWYLKSSWFWLGALYSKKKLEGLESLMASPEFPEHCKYLNHWSKRTLQ
jgi:hypothetical protein